MFYITIQSESFTNNKMTRRWNSRPSNVPAYGCKRMLFVYIFILKGINKYLCYRIDLPQKCPTNNHSCKNAFTTKINLIYYLFCVEILKRGFKL
jgi:hypothetical protein